MLIMEDYNTEFKTLSDSELDGVNGGLVYAMQVFGAMATTYQVAYETATFYGAGTFGQWLGGATYDLINEY